MLPRVYDCDNFYRQRTNAVHHNIIRMNNELARARYAANAIEVGGMRELGYYTLNIVVQIKRGVRIAIGNEFKDRSEVCLRFSAPKDRKHECSALHQ